MDRIALTEDYPSKIAQMLIDDQVDVGLIPVAATLQLPNWYRVTNYGIAADGEVASVCIFSQVPIGEIEAIFLDYQSRTSVSLAKILLKEYWKIEPILLPAKGEDFRKKILGTTAAVVIGDRALEERANSAYVYDLGAAWKAHTGLPFVFAAWIANKKLPEDFVRDFNAANVFGVDHIDDLLKQLDFSQYDLRKYFTQNIRYQLGNDALLGLDLFLNKLNYQIT